MNVLKIGEFIKKKRKEKNLTQKELANKLSITDRAISKWERGICCPDISLLKELCQILDITVNELLSGEELNELELDKSEDILVETVKGYASIEKRKNKRLGIFTGILLVFYVGLVFAMYLTYNQVNKNDNLNWDTYRNKKLMDKYFTALENYDYEVLKEIEKEGYANWVSVVLEDETKCSEYKSERESGERLEEIGKICQLKYFEEIGLQFLSHEFLNQSYINGTGEWSMNYELHLEYGGTEFSFVFSGFVRNGVIAEESVGLVGNPVLGQVDSKLIDTIDKVYSFFGGSSE